MTKIKICGLIRMADIKIVNQFMPDYIGFVFAKSLRQITLGQAMEMRRSLCSGIIPVGVFVDETPENIFIAIKKGIIEIIQLHGSENDEYIQNLKKLTNKPIIKAITIEKKGDAQAWENTAADFLLLDGKNAGSGKAFDWDLIESVKKPFFLAGGLNPKNVGEAIKKISPYAVDVSSGVESNGMKDHIKIKLFMQNIAKEGLKR